MPRATRTLVRKAVLAAQARYPQPRIVLTCRSLSYTDGVALPSFHSAELTQLDDDQVKRFIQLWYAAQASLKRLSVAKAKEKASELERAALSEHHDLAQESPLLLTVMAIVHRAETTLPRQRVRLYEKAVEVLLLRWHRGKDLEPHPLVAELLSAEDGQKLNVVLQSIAYEMHTLQSRARNAEPLLERGRLIVLLEQHIDDPACISAFLDFVDETSGLLIGQGGDPDNNKKPQMYGFPHRTFQEYLAGRRMAWGDSAERAEMLLARAACGQIFGFR